MSGDDGLLYPLGRRCCGASGMSDCHQYGLCLAVDIHPELAALRAKAAAADRVRELAEAFSKPEPGETFAARMVTAVVADRIRRALDGPPC